MKYKSVLAIVAVGLTASFSSADAQIAGTVQATHPRDAALEVTEQYRVAWLANDETRVMSTLSPDATLLPGGMSPISGDKAIRAFWWPQNGPRTKVLRMEQLVDNVIADVNVAVVRGHGFVTFVTDDGAQHESQTLRHNFVNVVRRQSNGSWLLVQRMWSDMRD